MNFAKKGKGKDKKEVTKSYYINQSDPTVGEAATQGRQTLYESLHFYEKIRCIVYF